MIEILQSAEFSKWLRRLKDGNAHIRIAARMKRMESGNLGDIESVGAGIYEARIHYGPGYRLYFIRRGEVVIVMLGGGDKSSQQKDIRRVKELAGQWR